MTCLSDVFLLLLIIITDKATREIPTIWYELLRQMNNLNIKIMLLHYSYRE